MLSAGCRVYYFYRSNPENSQTKSLMEVFKLAEKVSPDELKRAVRRGAYFNIKDGMSTEEDTFSSFVFGLRGITIEAIRTNNKSGSFN